MPEYTKAVSQGLVHSFMNVHMTALGNIKVPSAKDMQALLDLYTGDDDAQKVPPSTAKAVGDEAAGLPVMSIPPHSQ